jgi:ATP-dependent exoDNAse (exonuclease V) alpha subunit
MRLSSYVANLDNVIFGGEKINQVANDLINDSRGSLTAEQHKALSGILLNKSGIRVLRGRAGTGKSYVLGKANSIASNSGINVIGLAPTHRAKLALSGCGYENVDTVKGMLFKLANSRFDLPSHSLIVVDEAGMVGNDDYMELLRVAATRKCNVILAGDERQLASIGRGGMFEVFANKYGSSSILDIKRQESEWGKSVAMAFSKG